MLLANTLLPEERRWFWELAQAHADDTHRVNPNYPTGPHGAEQVPEQDPDWDYNTAARVQLRNEFLACIVPGLKMATRKAVNFQKFQEIMQKKDETTSEFLNTL